MLIFDVQTQLCTDSSVKKKC